ncbi:MAG: hypothetical protein HYU66_20100 [Armatimonadetes bacterium]|nr:hypothetical protein [Armatimonadota bacterium]
MHRRFTLGLVLVALLAGLPANAEKEPAIAGLLGLVPGFGTGYWYGAAGASATSADRRRDRIVCQRHGRRDR